MTTYDDNYPTCRETYATLRLFSDYVDPREITATLEVLPSEAFAKGEASGDCRSRKTHGWFLSSKGAVDSKDSRRHIDWIVSQLRGRANELRELQSKAVEIDISCYWLSVGPP